MCVCLDRPLTIYFKWVNYNISQRFNVHDRVPEELLLALDCSIGVKGLGVKTTQIEAHINDMADVIQFSLKLSPCLCSCTGWQPLLLMLHVWPVCVPWKPAVCYSLRLAPRWSSIFSSLPKTNDNMTATLLLINCLFIECGSYMYPSSETLLHKIRCMCCSILQTTTFQATSSQVSSSEVRVEHISWLCNTMFGILH